MWTTSLEPFTNRTVCHHIHDWHTVAVMLWHQGLYHNKRSSSDLSSQTTQTRQCLSGKWRALSRHSENWLSVVDSAQELVAVIHQLQTTIHNYTHTHFFTQLITLWCLSKLLHTHTSSHNWLHCDASLSYYTHTLPHTIDYTVMPL